MATSLTTPTPLANVGSVTVVNHCPRPVYYHVSGLKNGIEWNSETKQIPAGGFHIPYDTAVSVKLFHNPIEWLGSVSQLQFDLDKDAGRVWYDIFSGDAFQTDAPPFVEGGVHLTTVGEQNAQDPNCIPVHCAKGEQTCNGAYNRPEGTRTLNCPHSTSLQVVLCPQSASPSPTGPPRQLSEPTKALDYNNAEKSLKKRNQTTIMVGGLTWQCCAAGSKSHVAKLPIFGVVAGLAYYFLTF
jgi:hypothetical protein